MSEQQAEKLLAVLVLARSSSYLMSKFVLGELDTFNLLALRFLIAFAVLLVVLHKHCRQVKGKVLFHGAVIGTTFFLTLAAELTALHSAPSTTVSFLENCSIVLVPLMAAALRRRFPLNIGDPRTDIVIMSMCDQYTVAADAKFFFP